MVTHMFGCKSNASHSQREEYNWFWSGWGSPLPANTMWHFLVHKHSLCQICWGWRTSGLNRFSASRKRCFFFSHSVWLSCHQSEVQSPSLVTLCGYIGTFGHNRNNSRIDNSLSRTGCCGLRGIRTYKVKAKVLGNLSLDSGQGQKLVEKSIRI